MSIMINFPRAIIHLSVFSISSHVNICKLEHVDWFLNFITSTDWWLQILQNDLQSNGFTIECLVDVCELILRHQTLAAKERIPIKQIQFASTAQIWSTAKK